MSFASGPATYGDVHGAGSEPLKEHMKVASGWSDSNSIVTLLLQMISGGPEVMIVSGSPTAVQVWTAGVGSTFM